MYRVCVIHIDELSKLSDQSLALANYAKKRTMLDIRCQKEKKLLLKKLKIKRIPFYMLKLPFGFGSE